MSGRTCQLTIDWLDFYKNESLRISNLERGGAEADRDWLIMNSFLLMVVSNYLIDY